jgi:hypothetical protein
MTDSNPLQSSDPFGALLGLGAAGTRFPPNSRYVAIPTATIRGPDGRIVVYLRRRFVPSPEGLALLEEHIVAQGERLDGIAAEALGDPEMFWRLCDANRAMRPDDLTQRVGRRLRVTLPESIQGVSGA